MNQSLNGLYAVSILSLILPWITAIILLIGYRFFVSQKRAAQSIVMGLSAATGLGASLLPFIIPASEALNTAPIQSFPSFAWASFGKINFSFGILMDPNAAIVLATVAIVSLAIQIFSTWYISKDSGFVRYFIYLNLFIGAMFGLVLSSNLVQLFIFWEIMGACSFLLIGFWHQKKINMQSAFKAFIVTRFGDICLMMGIIALLFLFQTLDIKSITTFASSEKTLSLDPTLVTITTLLIFIGVIGKSAQFPLHIWLPDAMAGPTPVSALIHAATMVAAGVYLLIRINTVFALSPFTLSVITIIGSITIVVGALLACYQDNIKKVLAYSTISQLGYMVMATGIGANHSALFHLLTHAFFKALLFLAAGVIIHTMHTENMFCISSNLKKIKILFATFLIGAASLMGIPPFSGFWSKDTILESVFNSGLEIPIFLSFIGVFLTALYTTRQLLLVFYNKNPNSPRHAKFSSLVFFSLIYLSIGTILIGAIKFLNSSFINTQHSINSKMVLVSLFLVTLGIYCAKKYFNKSQTSLPFHSLIIGSSQNLNNLAQTIAGKVSNSCSTILSTIEKHIFDGAVINSYKIFTKTAALLQRVDIKFIDNIVNLNATLVARIGIANQLVQNGKLQFYLLFLILSLLGIFCLVLVASLLI